MSIVTHFSHQSFLKMAVHEIIDEYVILLMLGLPLEHPFDESVTDYEDLREMFMDGTSQLDDSDVNLMLMARAVCHGDSVKINKTFVEAFTIWADTVYDPNEPMTLQDRIDKIDDELIQIDKSF